MPADLTHNTSFVINLLIMHQLEDRLCEKLLLHSNRQGLIGHWYFVPWILSKLIYSQNVPAVIIIKYGY